MAKKSSDERIFIEDNGSGKYIFVIIIFGLIIVAGWMFTIFSAGADANAPNVLSGTTFGLLVTALFGAATVALTATAVIVALLTYYGWRQIRRTAVSLAVEQSIKAAESVATTEAKKTAEAEIPREAKLFLQQQLRSGGIVRELLAKNVSEAYEQLLALAPSEQIDQIIEAKIKIALERKIGTQKDSIDPLDINPDNPTGDDADAVNRSEASTDGED